MGKNDSYETQESFFWYSKTICPLNVIYCEPWRKSPVHTHQHKLWQAFLQLDSKTFTKSSSAEKNISCEIFNIWGASVLKIFSTIYYSQEQTHGRNNSRTLSQKNLRNKYFKHRSIPVIFDSNKSGFFTLRMWRCNKICKSQSKTRWRQ